MFWLKLNSYHLGTHIFKPLFLSFHLGRWHITRCRLKKRVEMFSIWITNCPALFCWKEGSFSIKLPWYLCQKSVTIFVFLNSVPLTCLSTCMHTPHFVDFSSFIITLEIPFVFQLCFFLKSCFCHFEVYIKHRISLSISTKNLAQILIWYLFS